MKPMYKYLLGAVAVGVTIMLYKKYNTKEVAPSKAKVATDATAEDEKSNACGCSSNIISSGKVSASKVSASKYGNVKGGCGCGCDKVGNKVSSNPLGAGKNDARKGY